jgi:hypothetical protein
MPNISIKEAWMKAWSSPVKRRHLIFIILLFPVFFGVLPYFFNYIEKRNGVVLNDLLLAQIPPHNVSVLIFAVIWGMILLILYRCLHDPSILITYCFTLAFVTIARVICISLVPLSPPIGLIPLSDPLSGVFYGEANITKDLFFSGHTATLMTIFLCLRRKTDRLIGLLAVVAIAILLLIQHIHYTIDILAAPVIVYLIFSATKRFFFKDKRKWKLFRRVRAKAYLAKNKIAKEIPVPENGI